MAIELHHLHPGHDDEMTRLRSRIAELERMDTEHTVQIAKMNGYINHLEEECHELRGDKAQLEETVAVLQLNAKNKSVKDDEINAVHQKSLARLHELARKTYPDQEEDHIDADGILCNMLDALGYNDLTDAWDKIGKWYS